MKKLVVLSILAGMLSTTAPVFAGGTDGEITGRSVGAAALSLIIWPGIGQAVNGEAKEKNITHAVLGLTGIFRLWSCYDALMDRQGGVWHDRI